MAAQALLTERALELLALPEDGIPRMLLDLGCGSGLSGEALSDNGHVWTVRVGLLCLWLGHLFCDAGGCSILCASAYPDTPEQPRRLAGVGHQPSHA